jgi:hypothetical protein
MTQQGEKSARATQFFSGLLESNVIAGSST